jgi:hypothetical protein
MYVMVADALTYNTMINNNVDYAHAINTSSFGIIIVIITILSTLAYIWIAQNSNNSNNSVNGSDNGHSHANGHVHTGNMRVKGHDLNTNGDHGQLSGHTHTHLHTAAVNHVANHDHHPHHDPVHTPHVNGSSNPHSLSLSSDIDHDILTSPLSVCTSPSVYTPHGNHYHHGATPSLFSPSYERHTNNPSPEPHSPIAHDALTPLITSSSSSATVTGTSTSSATNDDVQMSPKHTHDHDHDHSTALTNVNTNNNTNGMNTSHATMRTRAVSRGAIECTPRAYRVYFGPPASSSPTTTPVPLNEIEEVKQRPSLDWGRYIHDTSLALWR